MEVKSLRSDNYQKKPDRAFFDNGGRGETRTLIILRSLAPEASASTNSATRPLKFLGTASSKKQMLAAARGAFCARRKLSRFQPTRPLKFLCTVLQNHAQFTHVCQKSIDRLHILWYPILKLIHSRRRFAQD